MKSLDGKSLALGVLLALSLFLLMGQVGIAPQPGRYQLVDNGGRLVLFDTTQKNEYFSISSDGKDVYARKETLTYPQAK